MAKKREPIDDLIDAHLVLGRGDSRMSDIAKETDLPSHAAPQSLGIELGAIPFQMTVQPTSLVAVLTPFSHSLLARARTLATEGQYPFAVVLAQAACELRTEDAFIELMRHRKVEALGEAMLGIVETTSLANPRLRKVFIALTGEDPAQVPWWSDWHKSRQLRHDVAHSGATVTPQQATKAIDTAATFIAYITDVVSKARAN
jgi:hypothetical protein